MIRYTLECCNQHSFEMWFPDIGAFDTQLAAGHVSCPECGAKDVRKSIMAPAIGKTRAARPPSPRAVATQIRALREKVISETEDVGERFPHEAREMHNGEIETRPIRGSATVSDVRALREEGVPILPVPPEPPKEN